GVSLETSRASIDLEEAMNRRRLVLRGLGQALGCASRRSGETYSQLRVLCHREDGLNNRGLPHARATGDHRALVASRSLDRSSLRPSERDPAALLEMSQLSFEARERLRGSLDEAPQRVDHGYLGLVQPAQE